MIFKPGTGFVFSNYVEDKKKLNPFRVHFMRLFNPHVGSLRSPTWGFQKHNSYRVAKMENETHITNTRLSKVQLVPSCEYGKRNTYYKYKTFKSITRTELQIWKTTTHIINIRLLRVQSIPNCSPTSLLLFCHMVIMMKQ